MTPLDVQDELVHVLQKMLDGHFYKCPLNNIRQIRQHLDEYAGPIDFVEGEELVTVPSYMKQILVYPQDIPVQQTDDEEPPVPYVIVRLLKGEDEGGRDDENIIHVVIIIGIYDDNPDQQGYRDAQNIVDMIYQRFSREPNLNGKAVFKGPFQWAQQEDGYYPYFFAACTLQFVIPAIRREDEFA